MDVGLTKRIKEDFQKIIRFLLPSASLSDASDSVYGGALHVKVPSEFLTT